MGLIISTDGTRRAVAILSALPRRHRAFSAAVAFGVVLRILTQVTYWPGIQFPDSGAYLSNAVHPGPRSWHPAGYPLFLSLFAWTHQIAAVTVVQHLLGLVSAGLIYLVLRRLGAGGGWAAVGAAPVLLDPMQIYLEQYVLSDVLFMFLVTLVIAVVVLREVTWRVASAVGLLLALATLVRTIAVVVAVPVGLYWLLQRVSWRRIAVAAVALAVPLLGYAGAYDATHHGFALQGFSGRWLYGRVVKVANCKRDHVPAAARSLCPPVPPVARVLPSEYVWNRRLPYAGSTTLPANPDKRSKVAGRFADAVILHEPVGYLSLVVRDTLHAFGPTRDAGTRGWFTGSWRFYQPGQPIFWRTTPMQSGFWGERVHGVVLHTGARWLHDYERFVYTPGPAAALAIMIGLTTVAFTRRRRETGAVALLMTTGLLLLVAPIASVDLDYRYVLSAQELLIAGGALGMVLLRARWGALLTPAPRLRVSAAAVGTLVVAGLVTSNIVATEAYGDGGLRPATTSTMGSTNTIHGRLLVQVADEHLVGYVCAQHRIAWRLQFTLSATWLHGPPLLVAGDDMYVANGSNKPVWPTIPITRARGVLRPVLLSRRYPVTGGTFLFTLFQPAGRLVYIDPLGAGATAWQFPLPPAAPLVPAAGAPCAGRAHFIPVSA